MNHEPFTMINYRDWFTDNPVLGYHVSADIRSSMRQPYWRAFAVTLLILYLWLFKIAFVDGAVELFLTLEMVAVCLVSIPMSHAMMAMEFEKATWEALVLTRLSAGQIVFGKLLSRLILLSVLFAVFLPLILVGMTKDRFTTVGVVINGQLLIMGWCAFLVAGTLWLSYRLRRGMAASATAFVGQMFLIFVAPALWAIFVELFSDGHSSFDPKGWAWMIDLPGSVVYYSPGFALQQLLSHSYRYNAYNQPDLPVLWGALHGVIYLMLAGLIIVHLLRLVAGATKKRW